MKVYISHALGSQSDIELGGPGSGNWAHAGRPGQIGGSQPRNSGMSIRSGKDWLERYRKAAGKEHPEAEKLREAFEKPTGERGHTEAVDFESYEGYKIMLDYGHWDFTPASGALYHMGMGTEVDEGNYGKKDARMSVKHEIVTELSKRTGVGYNDVNSVLHQWAVSSNDTDYRSLCLQEDAAAEFGIKLSDWQKERIAEVKEKTNAPGHNHVLRHLPDPHGASRKILRAMYELTQEQFKKLGITEVVLFRGMFGGKNSGVTGQRLQWKGNALESWTSVAGTAGDFAGTKGVVIAARIPVTRLLSNCRTGFGCLDEFEYIVMSSTENDLDMVTVAKGSGVFWN